MKKRCTGICREELELNTTNFYVYKSGRHKGVFYSKCKKCLKKRVGFCKHCGKLPYVKAEGVYAAQ